MIDRLRGCLTLTQAIGFLDRDSATETVEYYRILEELLHYI